MRFSNTGLKFREFLTFVSMRQKRVYMTVSSDLATDNRVHRSCMLLCQLNFDVVLVGRLKSNSPKMPLRNYRTKRLKLIFEKGALFYAFLNIRLFFLLLFKRLDYIFANDLDTLLAAYAVSKIKRKPILYDSHELFTEVPELIDRPVIRNLWLKIERRILPRLKEMITVNNSIAMEFEARYKIASSVVRNVPERIEKIEHFSKEELQLSTSQKMLIIQGSGLNIERGIEEAIMAMEHIENAVLFLVGDGDVIPKAKELVDNLRLASKVRFVGRIPYSELMRYTASADLGLALDKPTSLNYQLALPNKVFDYIQASVPIVSGPLIEIERLIKKYECGIVIEKIEIELLVKELNSLLIDGQRLAQLKNNCQKAAQIENWDIEQKILAAAVQRVFI